MKHLIIFLRNDLSQYFRQQRYRRQARRWLQANDGVALAAELMFKLNHYAYHTRRHDVKYYIYRLKNCFIKWLYENGYCTSVRQQHQILKCNSCYKGVYWTGEECYHCDGTGIYRETILYQFFFEVSGKTYIWHQPSKLVWWAIMPENEMPGEWTPPRERGEWFLNILLVELYTMTIFEFLRQQKATEYQERVWKAGFHEAQRQFKYIKPPVLLGHIVARSWKYAISKLRYSWRRYIRGAQIQWLPNQMISDDEIPF